MARLYEYQGKAILERMGVAVPKGKCTAIPDEAQRIAQEIGKPVVVKAQVWTTGRLKLGCIQFAGTPEETKTAAQDLIGKKVKGLEIKTVLVEERLDVEREFYAGVIVSNSHKIKGPILIFSSEGGSSIEEVAERNPERIARLNVDYLEGVDPGAVKDLIRRVDFKGGPPSDALLEDLCSTICSVYHAFTDQDARSIEINPLILTRDKRILAADCHVTIDDNSVFRHPDLGIELPRDMDRPPTQLEKKAWGIEDGDYRGTGYFAQMTPSIEGEGWIGFHGIGGGGAMLGASALVARGLKIANYADTSGDPPASKIYMVIKCILTQPISGYVLMGSCLANQELWHHGHALVKAFREEADKRPGFPVVMLIAGNKERETHEIIREGFKDLPIRWELYGRKHIYDTDLIADRVEALLKTYQEGKEPS